MLLLCWELGVESAKSLVALQVRRVFKVLLALTAWLLTYVGRLSNLACKPHQRQSNSVLPSGPQGRFRLLGHGAAGNLWAGFPCYEAAPTQAACKNFSRFLNLIQTSHGSYLVAE